MAVGGLTLSQLATGCGTGDSSARLKVQLLKNSIPAQVLGKFRRELPDRAALDFTSVPQLAELFTLLQDWKPENADQPQGFRLPFPIPLIGSEPKNVADLVTIGDYWLSVAVRQNLIQPLSVEQLSGWQQLPERWQQLVRRDRQGQIDPQGDIWAAPYRWSNTVIAYRADKFKALGWQPRDWGDLWRPELRDRISLLDSPREVIGLTLKKLGRSYNSTDLNDVPELKAELQALHEQVRLYSSSTYLQPLILGDTWVAVGWSGDVLPVMRQERSIAAIVPQSGTALTADLWVRPAAAPADSESLELSLVEQWINFCWQPQIATQLSLISKAASPILTAMDRTKLPNDLQQNNLVLPDARILQQSEFLNPLPEATVEQYRRLWIEIREGVSVAASESASSRRI